MKKHARTALAWIARIPGTKRHWLMYSGVAAFGLIFFQIIEWVMDRTKSPEGASYLFDSTVMEAVGAWRGEGLTRAMTLVTHLGSFTFLTIVTLLLASALLYFRDRWAAVHLVVAMSGAAVIPESLKHVFNRTRPAIIEHLVGAMGLSFPSGHSFGSVTAYTTFAFFFARWMRSLPAETVAYAVAWSLVGLVGFSRVYLGVHYPSDVLAGWCAGASWSFLVAAGFMPLYARERVRRPGT